MCNNAVSTSFPKPKGLRHLLIIPEAMEMDYVIIDEQCSKNEVLEALDESLLHWAAYPAPHDVAGTDDGYYAIINPNPDDGNVKRFYGIARGMKWISPDGSKALFESRDSVKRFFEHTARMEKLFGELKSRKN